MVRTPRTRQTKTNKNILIFFVSPIRMPPRQPNRKGRPPTIIERVHVTACAVPLKNIPMATSQIAKSVVATATAVPLKVEDSGTGSESESDLVKPRNYRLEYEAAEHEFREMNRIQREEDAIFDAIDFDKLSEAELTKMNKDLDEIKEEDRFVVRRQKALKKKNDLAKLWNKDIDEKKAKKKALIDEKKGKEEALQKLYKTEFNIVEEDGVEYIYNEEPPYEVFTIIHHPGGPYYDLDEYVGHFAGGDARIVFQKEEGY